MIDNMFALTDPYARLFGYGGWRVKNEDTSKARKARKERARMLTRQREEELRSQRLSQKNAR